MLHDTTDSALEEKRPCATKLILDILYESRGVECNQEADHLQAMAKLNELRTTMDHISWAL